jgi:hypothetical protein
VNTKAFGLGILAVLTLGLGAYRWRQQPLAFQDIQPGQPIVGTDYSYTFRISETTRSDGTFFKTFEVFLTDARSQTSVQLPGNFTLRERPGEFICVRCVAILRQAGHTYAVTRSHNGGSGGYYRHSILALSQPTAQGPATQLSCGKVYRQRTDLIFPSHREGCPEFWPDPQPQNWDHGYVVLPPI